MTTPINETLNLAWSQLWQVTILTLAIWGIVGLTRRRWPHLAYLLWMLVIVKCLTPPLLESSTGLFCWTPSQDNRALSSALLIEEPMASEAPLFSPKEIDGASNSEIVIPLTTRNETPQLPSPPSLALILLSLWIPGAVVLVGVVIRNWFRCRRSLRNASEVNSELQKLVRDLSHCLGLRREVEVVLTENNVGPATFGIFRPKIVIPTDFASTKTNDQLAPILAHELIHVRRYDAAFGILQIVAQITWWFHPLVWWANRKVNEERERCCDEGVIAGLGCNPSSYVRCLIDVLEFGQGGVPALAVPGVHPFEVTKKRLEAIMDRKRKFRSSTPRWCWVVLLACGALVLPGAQLVNSDPPTPTQENPADSAAKVATPYLIKPFDLLNIKVLGIMPGHPINQIFLVEPSGKVALGPRYGRCRVVGLRLEGAQAAIDAHLRRVLRKPEVSLTLSGQVDKWCYGDVPEAPHTIGPGDRLSIKVLGAVPGEPIDQTLLVEPSGNVALGPRYGRCDLKGLQLVKAQEAIERHLKKYLTNPQVSITFAGWKTKWRDAVVPKGPFRISPGEFLDIRVNNTIPDHPIDQRLLVEPGGSISLGPAYGRCSIGGQTLEGAEAAIERYLNVFLVKPEVSVTLAGWKVIEDDGEDRIRNLESELKAIKQTLRQLNTRLNDRQ